MISMDHKMQNDMRLNRPDSFKHLEQSANMSDSLIAEMVLEKSLRNFRIEQIKKEIDISLAERNKAKFLRLVKELQSLT
jgi:uncharacterized protein YpiB (UPF0302 family)